MKEKVHECPVCSKQFRDRTDLGRHQRTHMRYKPHSCPYCSKPFTQHSTLRSHLRSHSKEKPFECTDCSTKFSHKNALNRHTVVHHMNNGEEEQKCPICFKAFFRKFYLDKHISEAHYKEKKFTCLTCSMRFSTKQGLHTHSNVHFKQELTGGQIGA